MLLLPLSVTWLFESLKLRILHHIEVQNKAIDNHLPSVHRCVVGVGVYTHTYTTKIDPLQGQVGYKRESREDVRHRKLMCGQSSIYAASLD
jgi:hypothetical protein